jgi:TIR domain
MYIMKSNSSQPLSVFYCYAREDRALRDELDKHLADLRRSGLIKAWYDGEILPGASWEKEIETHLKTAHVILLLVSADFIHSDYCYSKEMVQAIKRHDANEARVVPVLLRSTDCSNAPFNRLQRLPSDDVSVTSWEKRDEALTNVAQGIRRVVDDLLSQRSATLNMPASVLSGSQPSKEVASDGLPQGKQTPKMRQSPDEASLNDDFLKWLKKTAVRPVASKGQICQGICRIDHMDKVSPFEAKQFPGTNIIAGESIECYLTLAGHRWPWYHCFANDIVAEAICEAANKEELVEVTLECLGFLKQYTTTIPIGDDEDRETEWYPAYLIRSVKSDKRIM